MARDYMKDPRLLQAMKEMLGETSDEEPKKIKKMNATVVSKKQPSSKVSSKAEDTEAMYAALKNMLQEDTGYSGQEAAGDLVSVLGQSAAYAIDPSLRPDFKTVGKRTRPEVSKKDLLNLTASFLKEPKKEKSFEEKLEEQGLLQKQRMELNEQEKAKKYSEELGNLKDVYSEDINTLLDEAAKSESALGVFGKRDWQEALSDTKGRGRTAFKLQEYLKKVGATKGMKQSDIRAMVDEYMQNKAIEVGAYKPETLKVLLPDGRTATVSKEKFEEAKKRFPGLKVIK